jgi:hypothetical protein
MNDIKIIDDYINERINIDNLTNESVKKYKEKIVQEKNGEILLALENLKSYLKIVSEK